MLEFPQRTGQVAVFTCDEHTLSTGCSSLVCCVETMNARLILESFGILPALPISQKWGLIDRQEACHEVAFV